MMKAQKVNLYSEPQRKKSRNKTNSRKSRKNRARLLWMCSAMKHLKIRRKILQIPLKLAVEVSALVRQFQLNQWRQIFLLTPTPSKAQAHLELWISVPNQQQVKGPSAADQQLLDSLRVPNHWLFPRKDQDLRCPFRMHLLQTSQRDSFNLLQLKALPLHKALLLTKTLPQHKVLLLLLKVAVFFLKDSHSRCRVKHKLNQEIFLEILSQLAALRLELHSSLFRALEDVLLLEA